MSDSASWKDGSLHVERYVHLAGLTHDAALLSWGAFLFRPGAQGGTAPAAEPGDDRWMVVDDEKLREHQPSRRDSMGQRSRPYGAATVEVVDERGRQVASRAVDDRNHVWVDGLEPDTAYRYTIRVDGEAWSGAAHVDWTRGPDGTLGLRRTERTYACSFRTHPAPDAPAPLTFAAIGDFGVGVRTDRPDAVRQRRVARALERAVDLYDVRLVVTLGDNVYLGQEGTSATGDEDDDWFFMFYQPYRYLLDRIPFYPAVGNHDAADTERSDDRDQLDDNFFLNQRFAEGREAGRASVDPGLFYTFRYGADVELVCIDTTRGGPGERRYFERPGPLAFLDETFAPERGGAQWRFPFSHHPTYCAGPSHGRTERMEELLGPLFRRSGVRLALAGHEHNFQLSEKDGIRYVVSGAAAKLRTETPPRFESEHTRAWAAEPHFLVIEVRGDRTLVHPLVPGPDGEPEPLVGWTPAGDEWTGPIVISGRSA